MQDPSAPAAPRPAASQAETFGTLRPARPDDAADLARLAERTFRETFGAANTPENLEAHCAAAFGEAIQGREIADPGFETVVVERGGEFIAYAQLRWSEAPACISGHRPAEILRLYVDRPWHGRGLARLRMAERLARAARGGAETVWLGVWEHNPRAIAFYGKCGFREAGEHVFRVGADPQRDLILQRPPAGPPAV